MNKPLGFTNQPLLMRGTCQNCQGLGVYRNSRRPGPVQTVKAQGPIETIEDQNLSKLSMTRGHLKLLRAMAYQNKSLIVVCKQKDSKV
ncbi:hypothetical protein chiPu_0007645 [Chiloscyllium punctatum]|uniref:Uncharacterized protein n=1 Tax=Chiloscyllium punctatum TaxID=137246 RepID=A0A401SFN7_CHIPU|nr:hypothetical protein [Chiloscyllium punctatum]